MTKKRVHGLRRRIEAAFPDSRIAIDAPARRSGDWFVDVKIGDRDFVVEYRPQLGFGLSSAASEAYGEGPDEFYDDEVALVDRLRSLVRNKAITQPVRARLLRELRAKRSLTQVELAERLGIRQPTVSKLERRNDVNLSTLRKYVEALGGTLRVTAAFSDGTVDLALGDRE